ncbi:sensor histidine kinase [Moheibacter sediminis]|uniref:histidine kinase n=1 Tax=Moheibacter sediminis TaxID=1434700 RepID=A0A1W2AT44_9FLAO|nr:HAMP domain-containing sensor histidine kinase [Moheibacter sediminis]SMC63876.1 Histidine kinase-, DNA gyrase B-, and HSP90-like ATPase [Moheibacter sediminis]
MIIKTKYRQPIHYLLIASIILIQIVILVFFYNEYFNEKKLTSIENQIKETRVLRTLTDDSRKELLSAQNNLQKFVTNQDKTFLEAYFQSLRKLSGNIDSINIYGNADAVFKNPINTKDEISKLKDFENLIESTYKASQKPIDKKELPKIEKIEIKDRPAELVDVEVYYVTDSTTKKKKFFPRIADAIQGNVDVKRDTAVIITKYNNSVDTAKVKSDFDSTINIINDHYLKEIKKYETHISTVDSKNRNLYHNYDNLIVLSNNLMGIYDNKVQDFSSGLENEYDEQNSINNKIRKYSVLGLMVLMFFVLALLVYTTKLTFLYEKELKTANQKINESLNFKNRIIGMLSHEVRAPLKIINIFTKRIRKKTDDEKVIEYLNSIEFTNNSLLIQANQVLEYAKNQQKKVELQSVKFNLKEEIDSILQMFQPYVESRNNVFFIQNDIPSETLVLSDRIKIHQLFINLLGNANKFTENGKIEVLTHTTIENEKTVKLHVTIADTGLGISKSDLEKIFEPYFQGIVSNEINNLGAGLGLSLCKEIVQLFDGKISAYSTPGKGTNLIFEINLNLAE